MSETKRECVVAVGRGSGWMKTYLPCGNTAKMEHEGKPYCGIHDPVKAAERYAESNRKHDEKMHEEVRTQRLSRAAPDLLAAAMKALNYIENNESELGITLDSGDALRAAIAKAKGETV